MAQRGKKAAPKTPPRKRPARAKSTPPKAEPEPQAEDATIAPPPPAAGGQEQPARCIIVQLPEEGGIEGIRVSAQGVDVVAIPTYLELAIVGVRSDLKL